ncbi:phosphoserine aminotransferase [Dongia mobilis]|uniref:phosphoserine transaminase n=1 Tax=Dongia mobilis TaxID=578943 RepID=A0A4R6WPW7_9PROT|nr:phosphoserine transaminase [Dongia mobilis]TDQ81539.1 phosphoserine aminotransferase [Dongia mobilis]
MLKPLQRPSRPLFSSGPCAKRPGWTPQNLDISVLGRSHRSKPGKDKLAEVIERSKRLLGIPAAYRLGIVPASDTGAVEMALWSLLGPNPITVLAFESFSDGWASDIVNELHLPTKIRRAGYGGLPDLGGIDKADDIVFAWNGTTSGVRVPHGDWIADDRTGLTICDATSAVFATDLPWHKLDVVTWSWQKVLGGEGGHGMIALSPRAVDRLTTYQPAWPLPKIFRLAKGGKLIEGIFKGETINTPSMLCVEDQIDALCWAESVGGLGGLIARSEANLRLVADWVAASDWADFLAEDPTTRSNTSVCLKITDSWFLAQDQEGQERVAKEITVLLDKEAAGLDVGAYRDAPPGLRIWCGATVEHGDIETLLPWLDWAYATVKHAHATPVLSGN